MAGEDRNTSDRLKQRRQELEFALREAPYKFGFLATIRALECLNPDKPRLGSSVRAKDEPLRIAQEPHTYFAPANLVAFEQGKDGKPPRLVERFLGVFGPNGPLPLHLTEHARERSRSASDPTFSRFADIFHHRMLSLFYRAWASPQPTVSFDRFEQDSTEDRFAQYVGSLFGQGRTPFWNRDEMPDLAKLHYSGHMGVQTHHPDSVSSVVEGFFGLPVKIREFIGQWLEIPVNSQFRLGDQGASELGESSTAGSRVWQCQHKFRVCVGPIGLKDFQNMLPGGENLGSLVSIVRNTVGDEMDWDLNLVLKKEEVPGVELGKAGQLGWTSWLTGETPKSDADNLCLNALDYV